jgi:hypothetical protein
MTDDESFVRTGPAAEFACGALVSTGARRYRCPFVPNGLHGIGCNPDHTSVLLAEYRLQEAIENAHRSGLSASEGWKAKQPPASRMDTLGIDRMRQRQGAPGAKRGRLRSEHVGKFVRRWPARAQRHPLNGIGAEPHRCGARPPTWAWPNRPGRHGLTRATPGAP